MSGCNNKETYVSFSSGYEEGRILSLEQNDRSLNVTAQNIMHVSQQYTMVTKEAGKKTAKNDALKYNFNKIVADKSVNFLINRNLISTFRQSSYLRPRTVNFDHVYKITQSNEYRQLFSKSALNKVTNCLLPLPSPSSLLNLHRSYYTPSEFVNLNAHSNQEELYNDDLDINAIIDEFRKTSPIQHDFAKKIFTNQFFIMNLNNKVMKYLRDNNYDLIYKTVCEIIKLPPEGLFLLLKEFGFDVILIDDVDPAYLNDIKRHFPNNNISHSKLCNNLAMEFINNDYIVDYVANACNSHVNSKQRMSYTKMFNKTNE